MTKLSMIVAGGGGFISSHVVDALLADGFTVVAVDDLSTGAAERVSSASSLEVVDIADDQASNVEPALAPRHEGRSIAARDEGRFAYAFERTKLRPPSGAASGRSTTGAAEDLDSGDARVVDIRLERQVQRAVADGDVVELHDPGAVYRSGGRPDVEVAHE